MQIPIVDHNSSNHVLKDARTYMVRNKFSQAIVQLNIILIVDSIWSN